MSKAAKRKFEGTASDPHKQLLSFFKAFGHRHSMHEVFSDFVELSALTISNAVDRHQFDAREKRYLEIVKRYEREDLERFSHMLGALTLTFEDRVQQLVPHGDGLADVLGQTYMMLELGNDRAGQFFTPYSVSRLMASINIGDGNPYVDRDGFVTISEPACGAGGMVIACADALHDAGRNYQQTMHATCIDIDPRCVHMAYVQLSLLNIPAIVVHGNALSVEAWGTWFTPAHILGGWGAKLRVKRFREAMESLTPESVDTDESAAPSLPTGSTDLEVESILHVSADPEQARLTTPAMRVFVPDDQLALF
ncbi:MULTISPECIES: N-6 DNA methylase [unclassified Cupriavidus]|uniref:N-6 DNA methylase n=1 Tax=unclassified Cupriavidus TaxID=2640874 RepID=UPI0010F9696E|nr:MULTISPECIES: N-6 DNA methylase [unclassified Cupriavidus]MWL92020.1 N-6 DNA methylase [Cupriavidus sp. SW-Y-13]